MNSAGWRAVHASDAIAVGDGPANAADPIPQEFPWSRSYVTLLLRHSPGHLGAMPWRLRYLFVFCQMIYPCLAPTSAMLCLAPLLALGFGLRFADVTHPAFVAHAA